MKLHGSIVAIGSVDYQDEGLRPGGEGLRPEHVQEAQATGKTKTTPVAVSPLVPQAFVASACQGPPGLDDIFQDLDTERSVTYPDEDEWKSPPRVQGSILEDGSQEAKTPELDECCRICLADRNGILDLDKCDYCGTPFVDSKEPWSDAEEKASDQQVPFLLDVRSLMAESLLPISPLTIDPVSTRP